MVVQRGSSVRVNFAMLGQFVGVNGERIGQNGVRRRIFMSVHHLCRILSCGALILKKETFFFFYFLLFRFVVKRWIAFRIMKLWNGRIEVGSE